MKKLTLKLILTKKKNSCLLFKLERPKDIEDLRSIIDQLSEEAFDGLFFYNFLANEKNIHDYAEFSKNSLIIHETFTDWTQKFDSCDERESFITRIIGLFQKFNKEQPLVVSRNTKWHLDENNFSLYTSSSNGKVEQTPGGKFKASICDYKETFDTLKDGIVWVNNLYSEYSQKAAVRLTTCIFSDEIQMNLQLSVTVEIPKYI